MNPAELIKSTLTESPIESGLKHLQKYFTIDTRASQFITNLGKALPKADPYVQSDDGVNIDIFWEDIFAITVEKDSIIVSDFSSGAHIFKDFTFGKEEEEAFLYIVKKVQDAKNFELV